MSNKWILVVFGLGLIAGGAGCFATAPAQDKPTAKAPAQAEVSTADREQSTAKTPAPVRPLPPAKPQPPAKPAPAPTESPAATVPVAPAQPTQLTPPMPATAVDRALAKKVALDLTNAPLSDFVAAIKNQTDLEIRVAPDALVVKDEKKSPKAAENPGKPVEKSKEKPAEKPSEKAPDKTSDKAIIKPADKSAEKTPEKSPEKPSDQAGAKPAEKPVQKPGDKPADNPADKSAEKPAEKPAEKAPDKPAETPADDPADKAADSEPVVSVHLKGITAASALNLVLRDVGLAWSIDHGGIFIAPQGQLPPVTTVYDVRDLVLAHPSFDSRDDATDLDYDPLVNLITGVIQCPGWAADVEKIQDCNTFHGTLTVRQDQQVQQKVAGLLAALRKARDLPAAQYNHSTDLGYGIVGADDSAVWAALDANVDVGFNGVKLGEAANWIREHCGIPVHIDSAVPQAVEDGQSFTLKTAGVSLRAMLKALLPQGKLAFTVTDETLVITSQDDVADLRSIRVYPVSDLITGDPDRHGIDEDYAQLLDSITQNVQPDSWAVLNRQKPSNSSGNAYAAYLPAASAIVFDQTSAAQEEIAATLAKLRAAVALQPAPKQPATHGKPDSARPAKPYLSMRIYKLNADLPADDFVAVVHDLVEPKSWTGEAYLHGVPGAIVVKATPAIHKRVERLLIELGAILDPKKSGGSGTPILIGREKRGVRG